MRRGLLLLLFALCACQGPVPETPRDGPSPPAAEGQAIATLAGEWRVAGIDGKPFDEAYGLALSGDDSSIWWAPRCAGFERTYELSGIRVRFQSPHRGLSKDDSPPVVCQIGIPSRLPDVFRAIDSADSVVRTPANAIEISGGGHSLTLFSQ